MSRYIKYLKDAFELKLSAGKNTNLSGIPN